MPKQQNGQWRWLWLTVVVLILDFATKYLANTYLVLWQPKPVIPGFFNLTLAYNQGAAFSFLSSQGGWQQWLFIGLALIVSIVIFLWLKRLPKNAQLLAAGLSLILAGALGNLVNRLTMGYVIDFIQLYYKAWAWPTFNIADSAICIGAVLLIIHSIRKKTL